MKMERKILTECQKMIDVLNSTKGTNNKKQELKKFEFLHPLIKRIWDPNTTTGLTKKSIDDFKNKNKSVTDFSKEIKSSTNDIDMYNIFDALTKRHITGDTARAAVWMVINRHPEHEELIKKIYEKNLRMRIGAKTISEIWPEMFKIFSVTLAEEFDEKTFARMCTKAGDVNPVAFISDKIDGVRLITLVKNNTVEFFSRTGTEFTSLNVLRKAFGNLRISDADMKRGLVFDGELIVIDDTGAENFKLTVSEARKKDIQMGNPKYKLFDLLYDDEFYGETQSRLLSERYEKLSETVKGEKYMEVLRQIPYSKTSFTNAVSEAKNQGREGLIIRVNTFYEPKRTKNILKYKFFQTEEFVVKDLEIKKMPFPNKTGGEDFVDALNSVIIEYKKCPVWVGSGFSMEERIKFYKNPKLIRGKLISVQFQEVLYDKVKKTWSLRMPIFKALLGNERDF